MLIEIWGNDLEMYINLKNTHTTLKNYIIEIKTPL